MATSPDGKLFAALTAVDGRVKLADNLGGAPDREVARLPVNSGAVLTFAPDGRTLAVASTFRSLTLCDLDAGQSRKILPDPTKGETHFPLVEFAPDGRSLMLFDGETRVVETITGGDRVFLSREPAGRPGGMAWSADGRLVARGFDDGTAIVTDLWTGRELFRRQTGQGAIHALGLSRDGKRLVTGGMNSTGVVWELDPFGPPRAGPKGYDAWADLEEIDAGRAYRAMLGLIASPGDTPALIAKQFEARPPVEAGRIDRLVADLDADDYKVRERAGRELLDLGPLAAAALKKAARSPSLEVKRRAADLLGRIEPGRRPRPGPPPLPEGRRSPRADRHPRGAGRPRGDAEGEARCVAGRGDPRLAGADAVRLPSRGCPPSPSWNPSDAPPAFAPAPGRPARRRDGRIGGTAARHRRFRPHPRRRAGLPQRPRRRPVEHRRRPERHPGRPKTRPQARRPRRPPGEGVRT